MTNFKDGSWVYSGSDDIFHPTHSYDTKAEAVAAAYEEYADYNKDVVYVGQVQNVEYAVGVNVDDVLEHVHQNVYDEVGGVAEDYLNHVTKAEYEELEHYLNAALHGWMSRTKHYPEFYRVVNISRVGLK